MEKLRKIGKVFLALGMTSFILIGIGSIGYVAVKHTEEFVLALIVIFIIALFATIFTAIYNAIT